MIKPNVRIVEVDHSSFIPVVLKGTSNDREMYEILIREFPELKNRVLIYDVDGIGMSFAPTPGNFKWRSLEDVYLHFLPEINRRADKKAYELELTSFIDDQQSHISNQSIS